MTKSKARTFNVVFEPDDGGWHAWIPSVQGCRTWGRSLVTVRRGIREALAACVDVFGDDAERVAKAAEFDEEFKLPAEAKRELARRTKAMQRARAAETAARDATRRAAKLLEKKGLSLRDAGAVLGLSHERVKQVMESRPPATR